MNIQTGVSASSVLRGANHVVFVEGSDDDAFDPTVIRELLRANNLKSVEVRAFGPCDNVFQAAKAMAWKHPTYYFLADRDAHESAYVERGWAEFPIPNTYNLIHWRKRELENYFIEPSYIEKSEWLIKTPEELRAIVLAEARRRLFIEASNIVLLKIRTGVLIPPTAWFKQVERFTNRADALTELQNAPALSTRETELSALFAAQYREQMFDEALFDLTGGKTQLEYGAGTWLERLSGKEIFRSVAGSLFRVQDASGTIIQGIEQNNEVAKGLLKLPMSEQPADFQQLIQLLNSKIQGHP